MEAVAGVPFRAMLPLFGVGVLTLLLTLCFCCYLWRLKRQGQRDTGYIVIKYKKKYSKKNSTELAVLQPEGGSVCPVCLDEFSEGDKVAVTLPCRHSFHCKCLSQWLANSACCPMCKTLLRLHDNDHTHLVTELVVAG